MREDSLDHVVPGNLDIDKVLQLPPEGCTQILERFKGLRDRHVSIPICLPGLRIHPIMQGKLQHLHQVEIAGQNIGFCPEGPALHAAGGSAVAGILQAFPLPDQLLDNGIGVEDGGLTKAGFDNLYGPVHKTIGILLADLHHGGGLQKAHLLDHIQQDISSVRSPHSTRRASVPRY